MREPSVTLRADGRSLLAAEVAGIVAAAAITATGAPIWVAALVGAVLGAILFIPRIARLSLWQWAILAMRRFRHREHRLPWTVTQ